MPPKNPNLDYVPALPPDVEVMKAEYEPGYTSPDAPMTAEEQLKSEYGPPSIDSLEAQFAMESEAQSNYRKPQQFQSEFGGRFAQATPGIVSGAEIVREEQDLTPPQPGQARGTYAPGKRPGEADVAGWENESEMQFARESRAKGDYGQAMLDAEGAQIDRASAAREQGIRAQAEADRRFQEQRDLSHRAADQETATWLRKQVELSEKEPNRARYWENQSGFGKAVWLASVGLMAFANSKSPNAKNVILEMLMHEVEQDTASQKDRLGREVALGETKGRMMKDRQNRLIHDQEDDYAKTFQRLEAVKQQLLERAKKPGSAEARAVEMGVIQDFEVKMSGLVNSKREQAFTVQENNRQRAATAANQARQIEASRREKVLDRAHDKDMAQISLKAKFDEERAKEANAAEKAKADAMKDSRFIGEESGFSVVRAPSRLSGGVLSVAAGRVGEDTKSRLAVNKEVHKEAGETASNFAAAVNNFDKLEKALQDSTTFERITNSGELKARIFEAAAPLAKANNQGVLTDKDFERGVLMVLGVDTESVMSKLKGLNKEEQLAYLRERIREIPKNAEREMSTRYGSMLGEGERIKFNPDVVRHKELPVKSGETLESEYGKVTPRNPLQSVEDYNQRKKDNTLGTASQLPPAIESRVNKALNDMKGGDHTRREVVTKGVMDQLETDAQMNPQWRPLVEEAKIRVKAESEGMGDLRKKEAEAVAKTLGANVAIERGIMRSPIKMAEVQEKALMANLADAGITNISDDRKTKLLKLMRDARATFNKD